MPQYLATIPNNDAGKQAVNHLREFGPRDFGITYRGSLSDFLRQLSEVPIVATQVLEALPYEFHTLEVAEGHEKIAIPKILRWHSDPTGRRQWRGHIEAIEPNVKFRLSALGLPFSLGGWHNSYLKTLNIGAAGGGGRADVKVAVLDTGSDKLHFVTDFYDLTTTSANLHPGAANQVDTDGHGTAMATLIHEVAPGASISMVRIADSDPEYMHVLAGLAIAVCDCQAEIVNLSFGFVDFGGSCGACGANDVSRSIALEKMLGMLIDLDPSIRIGFRAPIFVAATGNQRSTTGFHYPAAFDYTIAVGSVTDSGQRSSFSNYGTTHTAFLVAPGGEEILPQEHVGSGSTGICFGTSVSTAYISGILALMRQDGSYSSLSREDLIDALLKMCVMPGGGNANEYGRGIFHYV